MRQTILNRVTFGRYPHSYLSGQTKALADWVVDYLMERQLPEGLVMPRLLANPIAGPIWQSRRLRRNPPGSAGSTLTVTASRVIQVENTTNLKLTA